MCLHWIDTMGTYEDIMADMLREAGESPGDFLHPFSFLSKDRDNSTVLVDDDKHRAINFDLIAKRHSEKNSYVDKLRSNDAFFVSQAERIFIEFKNGKIFSQGSLTSKARKQLAEKIFASILIAMDMGWVSSMKDLQENVQYLLVYSAENTAEDIGPYRNEIKARAYRHAGEKPSPPGLESMKWLFSGMSMCSEREFTDGFIPEHYQAG